MLLEELVEAFIYSRSNGTSGAKGIAREATIKNYRWGLDNFTKFMQDKRNRTNYEEITRQDMRLYIEYLHSNPKWKKGTAYGILRGVRALMHFIEKDPECRDEKLVNHGGLLGTIPQNDVRENLPGLKELKTLRAKFDTTTFYGLRNHTIFSLILGTGMRNGEIRALKVDDLHLDDGMLNVPPEGKTGSRLIPMDGSLVGVLKAWLRRRSRTSVAASPWLFPGRTGDKLEETGIVQVFTKLQPGVSREKRITAHTLRHFFGTHYLSKNGNIERLRLIMGHKSYETLQIYLHMAKVDSAEAKEELERVSPLKTVNSAR